MHGDWLSRFFSWQLAAWSALLLNLGAWLKIRNERKRDVSAEKAADWERLRVERDRALEDRDHWHAKYIESEARRIQAEATLQGYGEVRQLRAIAVAMKRLPPSESDGK